MESRWEIKPIDSGRSEIEISAAVRFTKRTVWKNLILHRSIDESRERYAKVRILLLNMASETSKVLRSHVLAAINSGIDSHSRS